MKLVQAILSLTLGLSALIGVQILTSDNWLWSSAPSHAYGLIGFVIIDALLAAVVLARKAPAAIGASAISITQFGAMIADSTIGQPMGVPGVAFRNYLLNDLSYTFLLGIQIAILAVSIAALTIPLVHRHVRLRLTLPRRLHKGPTV